MIETIMTTPFSSTLQNQCPVGQCGGGSLQSVEMGLERLQLEEEQTIAVPNTTSPMLSSSSLMTIEAVLRNKEGPPKVITSSSLTHHIMMMSNSNSSTLNKPRAPIPSSLARRGGSRKNDKSRLERWYLSQQAIVGRSDPTVVNVEKTRRYILRKL